MYSMQCPINSNITFAVCFEFSATPHLILLVSSNYDMNITKNIQMEKKRAELNCALHDSTLCFMAWYCMKYNL